MGNKEAMISFVIPCYCSERTIGAVVEEIIETIEGIYQYEIILVNDCSKDDTLGVIQKLCLQNPRIKGIDFARNFGQHSALMAGYRYAEGDVIVSLDDDGQTPPNECLKLIEPVLNGNYDVAIAQYDHKKQSWFKNFGSGVNELMARILLEKPKSLYCSSYSAMKRFVIDEIIQYKNPYPYLEGLVLRTTLNIVNVNVQHRKREIGTTNYSFRKLLKLWLNGFTAFSVKPLRVASFLGAILAIVGFIYSVYIIIHRLFHSQVSMGWSSIMAVQLIIGGAILCVLGLIGEYIGRIYICINNSPQYVIREHFNVESEKINEKEKKWA